MTFDLFKKCKITKIAFLSRSKAFEILWVPEMGIARAASKEPWSFCRILVKKPVLAPKMLNSARNPENCENGAQKTKKSIGFTMVGAMAPEMTFLPQKGGILLILRFWGQKTQKGGPGAKFSKMTFFCARDQKKSPDHRLHAGKGMVFEGAFLRQTCIFQESQKYPRNKLFLQEIFLL